VKWIPQFSLNHILWLLKFISYCHSNKVRSTSKELLEISFGTKNNIHQWLKDLGIRAEDISLEQTGKLVIYRNSNERADVERQIALQKSLGCQQKLLNPDECIIQEPALSGIQKEIAFGVHTPSEEAVDCEKLTKLILQRSGVTQIYDARLVNFNIRDGLIQSIQTTKGEFIADQYVIAAGMDTNQLLRQIKQSLLIEPIKGYSVSFPIIDSRRAPIGSITDQGRKVVFARIGNILRVAGFAEIIGDNLDIDQRRIDSLIADTNKIFPGAIDPKNYSSWAGLRPASPSGIPYIEKIGYKNLWVNAGHGSLGLTLSIGSAELLAKKMNSFI
jgi:D-amino-acid dehydrogenase